MKAWIYFIIIISFFSLSFGSAHADFFDSLTGTYGGEDFQVDVSLSNTYKANQSKSGIFSISPPSPNVGLMTWGRELSNQVWNAALEQTSLEMGISSTQVQDFLKYILTSLPENKTIAIAELLKLQAASQKAFNRQLSIQQQNLDSQIKQLSTEIFFDGVSDNIQKYDVVYEIMKAEAEWACTQSVNNRRLTISLGGEAKECYGFFCFFLRFENDPTPKFSETDDCILAHLQWLASYFYQGAKDPKSYLKRPLGLFGDVAAASKGNLFELPDNLPVQFHPIPLHKGKWYDFAGFLGGFWNSITNWGAGNATTAQAVTDDSGGKGKTKKQIISQTACAELTGQAKTNCLQNSANPTATATISNIIKTQGILQGPLNWVQGQLKNLENAFNQPNLDTKSICEDRDTMALFLDIAGSTGTNLSITTLQQNAQALCEGVLLGDSAAQKRASALIENSAGISGAIQLKIQTQTLQRLSEGITSANNQLINLLKLWQEHKTQPIDPTP